jgi:hypothetical protein
MTAATKSRAASPLLIGLAVVALLVVAGLGVAILVSGQGQENRANTIASDTAPAVLTLDVLCKRTDQLAKDLAALGACGEKIDKAKSAVDGQPQPAVADGLARSDVIAIVQSQIAGKVVTSDQVLALVTQVYNANRPADGKPGKDAPLPTQDQILAAVQAVCANDRCVGPAGQNGENGKDAPPATDAQLLAQVQEFCQGANQPCRGPEGPEGPAGPAGPACEAGYHVEDATSADIPPKTVRVCVKDAAPVEGG